MQVGNVQDCEILEGRRQPGDRNVVLAHYNTTCITPAAAMQHDQAQENADQGTQRSPVLDVEKGPALPENLVLVDAFHPEPLAQMDFSDTRL